MRTRWNRWCRYCLETNAAIGGVASLLEEWKKSTRLELSHALRHDLVGFEFPGEVELSNPSPSGPCVLRFGVSELEWGIGTRVSGTVFHGAFVCRGLFERATFIAAEFHDEATFELGAFRHEVDFRGVVFKGAVLVSSIDFKGEVLFDGATFEQDVSFEEGRRDGNPVPSDRHCNHMKFHKDVSFAHACFRGTAHFENRRFAGDITSFQHATFERGALFDNARFRSHTDFTGAEFHEEAWFSNARFRCGASFVRTSFVGKVHFGAACFHGTDTEPAADFRAASFCGHTFFGGTEFLGNAEFESAKFDGGAFFGLEGRSAEFHGVASFRYMEAERTFSLTGVQFAKLPDFVQAHFKEPPDLDLITIGREAPDVPAEELTARWRALKRMAAQTGHHYYTALFAAEETKARRPIDRTQRFSAWVVGWLYQWLSNFGLSIWRPLAWWTASLFLFAVVYNGASPKLFANPTNSRICQLFDGTAWITGKFGAALTYSLKKALVVGGLAKVEGLDGLGSCLFGDPIPLPVIFTGIFQTAFSGLLILLFILAVRNHMRAR